MSVLDDIKSNLATQSEGFAVVNDGTLITSSVDTSRSGAAMLFAASTRLPEAPLFFALCGKDECGCCEKFLSEIKPTAKIVSVKVQVQPLPRGKADAC